MNVLKSFGSVLVGIGAIVAMGAVLAAFLIGTEWVSNKVLYVLLPACAWVLSACVVILLPCSAFRTTRPFAALSFLLASFIFGTATWLMGFIATLELWGAIAVVVGLFFAGIGVVPLGILALAFHGNWPDVLLLIVGLLLTFGTRAFAFLLDRMEYRRAYLERDSLS